MTPQNIELKQAPKAEVALVVYSDGQISRHPVVMQGQQCAIGAGNLLAVDGLQSLLAPYSAVLAERTESALCEFIPSNVFCRSYSNLGWIAKPRRGSMWFSGMLPVADVPWCSLLFFASKKEGISLRVFAVKDDVVTPDTQLFHAPIMNVNSRGVLCFGNATKPNNISTDAIPVFEEAIYQTKFSHTNHGYTLLSESSVSNTDHHKFWKSLSGADTFPLQRLNPTKLTVSDLINGAE